DLGKLCAKLGLCERGIDEIRQTATRACSSRKREWRKVRGIAQTYDGVSHELEAGRVVQHFRCGPDRVAGGRYAEPLGACRWRMLHPSGAGVGAEHQSTGGGAAREGRYGGLD